MNRTLLEDDSDRSSGGSFDHSKAKIYIFTEDSHSDSLPDELASECNENITLSDISFQNLEQRKRSNGFAPMALEMMCLMTDVFGNEMDHRHQLYKTNLQKLHNEALMVEIIDQNERKRI